jgi:hypothetical protein
MTRRQGCVQRLKNAGTEDTDLQEAEVRRGSAVLPAPGLADLLALQVSSVESVAHWWDCPLSKWLRWMFVSACEPACATAFATA